MLKSILRISAAFLIGSVLTFPSLLQAQAQPPRINPPAPTEFRVKQVLGSKVHIQGDIAIGIVDDIVFADNGQIEYLIVLNDGKFVTVPWQAAKFNFEKRFAVVNITQEQYRVIPNFGLGILPRFFAPEYRTTTYKYYGLTPTEVRPVERAPQPQRQP